MSSNLIQLILQNIHIRPDIFSRMYPNDTAEIIKLTMFLPPITPLRQRYYHIIYDVYTIPKCQSCEIQNVNWNLVKKTYMQFCSPRCVANGTLIKRQNTCLERYGVSAPAKNVLVREKMQQTCVDRYGVKNFNQTEQGKINYKQTCMDRYGVTNVSQIPDIKTKKTNTSIINYGTNHPTQNTKQKEKVQTTCFDKYGVSNPRQVLEFAEKIKKTNLQKYGTEHVLQSDLVKDKIKKTNIVRYGVDHFSQAPITPDALIKSYDKEWLVEQHHTNKRTLSDIAQELQIDITSIIQRFTSFNIKTIRFGGSTAEKEVYQFLRDTLPCTIIQNDRSILNNLELDIWIPELNIAVEYCGLFWHSSGNPNMTPKYHQVKLQACAEQNIRLITLFEDEWAHNKQLVQRKLLVICNTYSQHNIYARCCNIVPVDTKSRKVFLDANHIQGDGNGSVTYGLQYNNEIVAIITFICKSNGVYELNRFATSCSVVGGFSKLLKHFMREHSDYMQIYTFADRRWSEGDMYTKTGFTLEYITQPTYDYIHGNMRYHRSRFMRKFLPSRLAIFEPDLSERQNCHNNRVYQIYNCGLKKYVLNK